MKTPSLKVILLTLLLIFPSIATAQFCSNELCEMGNEASTCPLECGLCGDLICDPCAENSASCADCYCGDFVCDASENVSVCPRDCLGSVCGDLVCDPGEICLEDCGTETAPLCGGGGPCGNGIVEGTEECDDSNTADGDCCSSLCRFETASCNDGNACTTGDQCQSGRCVGGASVNCDDGRACNGVETCDPSLGCPSPGACEGDGDFKGGGGCGLAVGKPPSSFLTAGWILLSLGAIRRAHRRK